MSNATVQISKPETLSSGKKLIRALLSGSFNADDKKLVEAWATSLGDEVKSVAEGKKSSVVILLDIRNLETYTDPELVKVMINLMKQDSAFVYRTASFGGTPLHVMIENIIASMSGRDNLKNLKTEEEALKWLAE